MEISATSSGAAGAYAAGIQRYPELAVDERNLFLTLFNDQALFFQGAFALHWFRLDDSRPDSSDAT